MRCLNMVKQFFECKLYLRAQHITIVTKFKSSYSRRSYNNITPQIYGPFINRTRSNLTYLGTRLLNMCAKYQGCSCKIATYI